jgi:hypothetical protein
MLLFFWPSLVPRLIHFSNDGPLAQQNAGYVRLPQAFSSVWGDLNGLGFPGGAVAPDISSMIRWLLGPVGYAKFLVPLTLLILGLSAWFCFRQMKLAAAAAILGGLAAMLDSGFFSAACWGVAPQGIGVGMDFLALAALASNPPRWRWLKYVLAGAAIGVNVMEGADIGALFSIGIAGYIVYQALMEQEAGSLGKRLASGIGQMALVAGFAGVIAAATITSLVSTQIQGIAGTGQDTQTKERQWGFATQWSLPKRETLGLIVPGLFGYGMATPMGTQGVFPFSLLGFPLGGSFQDQFDGGNYWGAMGRDMAWDTYFGNGKQGQAPGPGQYLRHTGSGNYPGLVVLLVAVWASLQALRKKDSVFSLAHRRAVWYWSGASVLCLLLAFGKHAPFYRLLYSLPYVSIIRNPTKFLLMLDFSLVILFAYGVHGLWRKYMEAPASPAAGLRARLRSWWGKAGNFDRRWVIGTAVIMAAGLVAWLFYASSRERLEQYLQFVQFDEGLAQKIASFSIRQSFWFLPFFLFSAGLLLLIFCGVFAGARARTGAVLLGSLMVLDLGRANQPWVIFWDYEQKYASNPVVDFFRDKPYEHRVALLPSWIPAAFGLSDQIASAEGYLDQLYNIEWVQQLFPYYDVQSLDIVQMPRAPEDLLAFERAFPIGRDTLPMVGRRWELCNNRYLIGGKDLLEIINQAFDPIQRRFRIATDKEGHPMRFTIDSKPGVTQPTRLEELTAIPNTNGPFAVFDFTGALPRAKLYANWQVSSDTNTLAQLGSAAFDPWRTVFVANPAPAPPPGATNLDAGTVKFLSYAPKRIELQADATAPSILLLNDRYVPSWQVTVDGKPATLLRCNFIMRGVQVPAGQHRVEFEFVRPYGSLYISLAGLGLTLALLGLLFFANPAAGATPSATPSPPRARAVAAAR